jgi:hypothetical protein
VGRTREQLVRFKYQVPFCRFVIRLGGGSRIRVDEAGQLGRFDAERVQFTDSRGRWMWIAYREIISLEFKDQPLIPPERWV